jgi:catalase
MTPVEKEHIIRAYTFELGKCYEQTIKERQLQALANIDPLLCQEVATGLGLPAPQPTEPITEEAPSPALSQLGGTFPPDGRMVGIVVDPAGDLSAVPALRTAILGAKMVPLLIGPHGGDLGDGLVAQRTFLTARSVEFDAVLLAGSPVPAPDALPSRDAKAEGPTATLDPRVRLLVEEAYRHAKVIGAYGAGLDALAASGCSAGDAGVVTGDDPAEVFAGVLSQLGGHRAWQRFATSIA